MVLVAVRGIHTHYLHLGGVGSGGSGYSSIIRFTTFAPFTLRIERRGGGEGDCELPFTPGVVRGVVVMVAFIYSIYVWDWAGGGCEIPFLPATLFKPGVCLGGS